MVEKTLFKIYKLKALLFMGKRARKTLRAVNTPEAYTRFLVSEQKKYQPLPLCIVDKFARHQTNASDLFCSLDEHRTIRGLYHFPYSADNTDIENAIAIMNHLSEHTFYSGCSSCLLPDSTIEILEYSYGRDFSHSLNCRLKAIALTDILISYGIKALPICMLSEAGGCHFVVHVYLQETNDFFVCDPSFNCYFTDEDNLPLSIFEMRHRFIENKAVYAVGYTFLGGEEFRDLYLSMFVRDCLSNISTWQTNKRNRRIYTKPLGIKFKTIVPTNI